MVPHKSRFSEQWLEECGLLSEADFSMSNDARIAEADHVIVPVSAKEIRRRMRGISQLLDDAGVDVDSVAGIQGSDCGWIVLEPASGDSTVDVVNLLGSVLAEVSGRKIVAFLGADPVCQSIESAIGDSMELELDPARTIILASADDITHDN